VGLAQAVSETVQDHDAAPEKDLFQDVDPAFQAPESDPSPDMGPVTQDPAPEAYPVRSVDPCKMLSPGLDIS
jgi:hypothetical protein